MGRAVRFLRGRASWSRENKPRWIQARGAEVGRQTGRCAGIAAQTLLSTDGILWRLSCPSGIMQRGPQRRHSLGLGGLWKPHS